MSSAYACFKDTGLAIYVSNSKKAFRELKTCSKYVHDSPTFSKFKKDLRLVTEWRAVSVKDGDKHKTWLIYVSPSFIKNMTAVEALKEFYYLVLTLVKSYLTTLELDLDVVYKSHWVTYNLGKIVATLAKHILPRSRKYVTLKESIQYSFITVYNNALNMYIISEHATLATVKSSYPELMKTDVATSSLTDLLSKKDNVNGYCHALGTTMNCVVRSKHKYTQAELVKFIECLFHELTHAIVYTREIFEAEATTVRHDLMYLFEKAVYVVMVHSLTNLD